MKKLLLPLALVVAAIPAASAQSFKVLYCTNSELTEYIEAENGGEIISENLEVVEPDYEYELPCYLRIDNLTNEDLAVSVTLACNTDETTLEISDGIQFCYPGNCVSVLPATGNGVIEPKGHWGGDASFHVNYVIGGPNQFDPINPNDYLGAWVGRLRVTNGNEVFETIIVLNNTGLGSLGGINADNNAPATYYNLQGMAVANPSAGHVYIRHQGGKATKVLF